MDQFIDVAEMIAIMNDSFVPKVVVKGGISRMVEGLLMGHMSYGQIVSQVREAFPDALTSTKSVASVARDMKKKGHNVPSRVMTYS